MDAFAILFPLAALLLPAVTAVNIGKYEVALPARTLHLRHEEIGAWSATPTTPPNPRFAAIALKRQAGGPTCGYYEYNSEPFDCYTNQRCITSDAFFACTAGSSPYTTCLDGFHSICSQSSEGVGTLCCNFNTDFPLCVTALKPMTSGTASTITGFRCGNNRAKGSKLIFDTKGVPSTSPATTSSDTTSDQPSSTAVGVPADSASATPSTKSVSQETPVGAIVGGVIGGLAVVGLTVAAVVWMLLRHRRNESNAGGAPSMMNQPYAYSAMPSTGAPNDAQSPPPGSTYDSGYKGYYGYQSTINSNLGSPGPESHWQPAGAPSIYTTAADGNYHQQQPTAPGPTYSPGPQAARNSATDSYAMHRLSEVPSVVGTGQPATELPSEHYGRY